MTLFRVLPFGISNPDEVNTANIANTIRSYSSPAQEVGRNVNRPNRKASVGKTSRFKRVEVTSPPRITIAIGPSISRPGSPLPIANGSRPSPVTKAVIRMGASRSEAPRRAVSNSHHYGQEEDDSQ